MQEPEKITPLPDSHHNVPPDDATILRERLERETSVIDARIGELVEAAGRVPDITDADIATKVATLAGQVNTCLKDIEKARKDAKSPFDAQGKVVQAFYLKRNDRLAKAKTYITPKQTAWEQSLAAARRKELEEAQKKAAEAETPEEAAEAIEQVREVKHSAKTRDDYGQTTSLRTHWKHEIVDLAQVPRAYLMLDTSAVTKAVRAGVRDIKGIRIFSEQQAVTRTQGE